MRIYWLVAAVLSIALINGCKTVSEDDFISAKRAVYFEELAGQSDDIKAQKAYEYAYQANTFKLKDNYPMAIVNYIEAIKYDSSAILYCDLANCYNIVQMYEPSIEYSTAALEMQPDLAEAYEALSTALLMTGEKDEAIKVYKKFAEVQPTDNNIYNLATLYSFSEYYAEALHYYNELYNKSKDPVLLQNIAHMHYKLKDTTKYIEYAKESYQKLPENTLVLESLFSLYWKQKQYDEIHLLLDDYEEYATTSDYRKMLTLALVVYSDSLPAEDKKTFGKDLLTRVSDEMLADYDVAFNSIDLVSMVDDTTMGMHIAEASLKAHEDNLVIFALSMFLYFRYSEYDKVVEIGENAIEYYPDDEYICQLLCDTYFITKQYDKAVSVAALAIDVDPNNAIFWNTLGVNYHELGEFDKSDSAYITALSINPGSARINNDYAYYLAERSEKLVYAQTLANKAIQSEPENPSYLDTYAWVCYKMEDYKEAQGYLEKALKHAKELEFSLFAIYLHLGHIYKAQGENAKALHIWNKATAIYDEDTDSIVESIENLRAEINKLINDE